MGNEGVALPVKVELSGEITEVVSSFIYFGIFFSRHGEPQEDEKIRVQQGLKTFSEMKRMFYARSLSLYE